MKRKRNLTGEQEQSRNDGLRLLARIIARHWLAHPECYDRTAHSGRHDGNVNYPNGAGGDTAAKEGRK
ncbi:MAG: hypothetical protein OXN21_04985 [Chloroflexota bacterium]|nr:hypothetical protein [Chloroflexota bacterium]